MRIPQHTFSLLFLVVMGAQQVAFGAMTISDHFSPRNAERPKRKSTRHIILHTTEGKSKGSLDKIHRNGEAHYFVDPGGRIYRIIDRDRVAYHAGRSMWNGTRNVDEVSIGIEIVGYHNKSLNSSQYTAVRELLDQLQKIYNIADTHVLPHSMVAYGAPNRWHRRSHRGRKRCGMQMASASVRRKLGLYSQPSRDPDVRAGRLVIGDPFLHDVLFKRAFTPAPAPVAGSPSATNGSPGGTQPLIIGNGKTAWDLARELYNSSKTKYVFPDGTVRFGHQITDWKRMRSGTRVYIDSSLPENVEDTVLEVGAGQGSVSDIAGDEQTGEGTIYFLKDGRVRTGKELGSNGVARLEVGTRVLVGYVVGGYISRSRSAYDVCGEKWNAPSTIYRFPDGSIHYGSKVNEGSIPRATQVFFRN